MGAVLRCIACPPVGGDTMWANMAKAYADLPDHVKTTIDGLKARHSIEASFGARMSEEKRHALKAQYPDAEHPVRPHPSRNRRESAVRFWLCHALQQFPHQRQCPLRSGFCPRQRAASRLSDRARSNPRISSALALAAELVAIWDNRCTQHYAVMDYPPCVRQMERAGIIGDKPY